MAEEEVSSVSVIAVTAAVGAIVLLFVLLCRVGRSSEEEEEKKASSEASSNGPSKPKQQPQGKKKSGQKPAREQKKAFTHAWLASALRMHQGPVLGFDFSPNGKYLASCSEDRTILIWFVKEFRSKEHKSIRGNVELDHATKVKFSPDNKAFVTSICNENTIRVYRIGKKTDGTMGNIQAAVDFAKKHKAEITHIGIASSGRFIMTCSKDTTIIIWNIKGDVLHMIDTHQVSNSCALVSPCGRFIGSSGFTPDVKVWEVNFDKLGTFTGVKRAFELKGHSAGVHSLSFSSDSHRMATVSKDGTWKLWNTNVEYHLNQDTYLLQTGQYPNSGFSMIALSPDARTVAIATGSNISVFNAETTQEEVTMENVHNGAVTHIEFDQTSRYLVESGDKHLNVFNNVTGLRATITDLRSKKKTASSEAMKERIQQQIDEALSNLKEIGIKTSA